MDKTVIHAHTHENRRAITYVTVLRVHVLIQRHDGRLRCPCTRCDSNVATRGATPTHECLMRNEQLPGTCDFIAHTLHACSL